MVKVRDLQQRLNRGSNSEYTEGLGEYSRCVKYRASESRRLEWEVKTLTLALSIPKPTVSLAYIHSSRLATRVMATLPSCETTWERKWQNCPPSSLKNSCGSSGWPALFTMQSMSMNLSLSSLKAWWPFLSYAAQMLLAMAAVTRASVSP